MARLIPVFAAAIAAAMTLPATAAPDLESGFRNPPAQARPQIWWHWMNGNVSREGITADLAMQKLVSSELTVDGGEILGEAAGGAVGRPRSTTGGTPVG